MQTTSLKLVCWALALFLFTGINAMALSLRQEMRKLMGLAAFVQGVTAEGMREPTNILDERIDSALAKFAEIDRSLVGSKLHVPEAARGHSEAAAYIQAYKDRIDAQRDLFNLLKAELAEQRTLEAANRDFTRAGRITEQLKLCQNRAHADFLAPTMISALGPETCRFTE